MVALAVVSPLLVCLATVMVRTTIRIYWRELSTRPATVTQLDPVQAAYLAGGPRLARDTGVGMLGSAGLVHPQGKWGKLRATGRAPAGLPPLCRAIHRAARDATGDAAVDQALTELRQELERDGLLRTADDQRTLNRGFLAIVPLVLMTVLGGTAVDALTDVRDPGQWSFWLFWPVLAVSGLVSLLGTISVVGSGLTATRAGQRELKALRTRYSSSRPVAGPAPATLDIRQMGFETALFGTGHLWARDPKFAEKAWIRRPGRGGTDGGGGPSVGGDGGGGDGGGA